MNSVTITSVLAVAIGGAIGSVGRYAVGLAVAPYSNLPIATFSVNVVGSFVMGLVLTTLLAAEAAGNTQLRPLVAVGFLGGLTTFSTFSLDAVTMLERGAFLTFVMYVLLSVCASLAALFAGLMIGRHLG